MSLILANLWRLVAFHPTVVTLLYWTAVLTPNAFCVFQLLKQSSAGQTFWKRIQSPAFKVFLICSTLIAWGIDRTIYFGLPVISAPFIGAGALLLFWVSVNTVLCNLFLKETEERVTLAGYWCAAIACVMAVLIVFTTAVSWDWFPGNVQKWVENAGVEVVNAVETGKGLDLADLKLVSPNFADYTAYTEKARLTLSSRIALGTPTLENGRYVYPLNPTGLISQAKLVEKGVPFVEVDSGDLLGASRPVEAGIRFGDGWLLDRNTRRIAWENDWWSRIEGSTFHVTPEGRAEWWYFRGHTTSGWYDVIITHASVVDATTGQYRSVSVSDFPSDLQRVANRDLLRNRFNRWGRFHLGWGNQWRGGDKLEYYVVEQEDKLIEATDNSGRLVLYMPVHYHSTGWGKSGSNVGYAVGDLGTQRITFYYEPTAGASKVPSLILGSVPKTGVTHVVEETIQGRILDGHVPAFISIVETPDADGHGHLFRYVALSDLDGKYGAFGHTLSEALHEFRAELLQSSEWRGAVAEHKEIDLTLRKKAFTPQFLVLQTDELPGRYLHVDWSIIPDPVLLAEEGSKIHAELLFIGDGEILVQGITLAQ